MQQMMTLTISRKHKLVLLAALLIAAGSTFYMLVINPAPPPNKGLHYACFKTAHGWGYDILVNDRIVIHQPMIPGVRGYDGFKTEKEAGADAQNVIESIKSGTHPFFGQKPLQRPGVLRAQPK
jgi:hypothetical protein